MHTAAPGVPPEPCAKQEVRLHFHFTPPLLPGRAMALDNYRDYNLTEDQKTRKSKYTQVQKKYEYLDHTADVQLHAWGDTLEEAFEQCAMAMFGYMTDTETVEPLDTVEVKAEGHDMLSLLYNFLNEWLYKFSAEDFFVPRGTEVKAITYSAMQVHEDEKPEVFVIIDI
ncbi:hypothetical protein JRQ81_011988 [Phrynocephalus forsythii]|uniref:Protein archease n=1 Tax=Phrynocephalus forsythii TaxID=171643 RepID=A0A9Q0X760_9SAUR|nr:hypothetical protein JRQ81_011988 [Phrynocephalus forsythii]